MIPFADAAPLLALTVIITGFMCWFVDMVDRKTNPPKLKTTKFKT